MHWFLDPLQKHYADFEGRIGRQEFWMFVLFVCGINVVCNVAHLELIGTIIGLALLVPNLGMGARRLHDTGRSGWWQLLMCIPIVGWIMLIVWLAQETTPVDNMYGAPAQPKMEAGVASTVPEAPVATVAPVAAADETAPVADAVQVTSEQQS